MKRFIYNPNFVFIAAFLVPFLFYSFGWSTLYPQLKFPLFVFYLFTFLIALVLGIVLQCAKPFRYTTIRRSKKNGLTLWVIYILYFLEVAYSRKIPLIGLLTGTYNYAEDNFGIPALHTFLVSFNTYFCIYLIHQYFSTKKKSLLLLLFWAMIPFVFLVYRSSIMSVLLGGFIVFSFGLKTIPFRMVLRSFLAVSFVLFLFGALGNLRSANGDSTFIPRASGATEQFLQGPVPNEFYWSYLYIASPVANLQNNIDFTDASQGTFHQLVINECLPNLILKFLPFLQVPATGFHQINPSLNVGTMYVYSFSYLRWNGVLFFFLYFILLVNIYYLIIKKSTNYRVTGLAILFNVIIFANFHNTIAYSASSIQLLYPVFFSMLKCLMTKKVFSGPISTASVC